MSLWKNVEYKNVELFDIFSFFCYWRKNVEWYEMTLKSSSATNTFDIFSFLKNEFDIFFLFKIWVWHFFLLKYTVRHFFLFQILQQKCRIVIFFLIRHFFLDHKKRKKCRFDIFAIRHFFLLPALRENSSMICSPLGSPHSSRNIFTIGALM